MKRILLGLVLLVAGCGNQAGLIQARAVCDRSLVAAGAFPATDLEWDTAIILLEIIRDSGVSKLEAAAESFNGCSALSVDGNVVDVNTAISLCVSCGAALVDAVWP